MCDSLALLCKVVVAQNERVDQLEKSLIDHQKSTASEFQTVNERQTVAAERVATGIERMLDIAEQHAAMMKEMSKYIKNQPTIPVGIQPHQTNPCAICHSPSPSTSSLSSSKGADVTLKCMPNYCFLITGGRRLKRKHAP